MGNSVAVALEGAIDDIGAVVVHERHHRLVHGTVPLHVAWVSVSVSVAVLVVLMEHRLLTSHPLAVSIGNRRVSGQNTGDVPVEQLGVVHKGFSVEGMVVEKDWPVESQAATDTSHAEVHDPGVGQTATHVEASNRQFTDSEETQCEADLSSGSIVSVIEVRAVDRACYLSHLASREP